MNAQLMRGNGQTKHDIGLGVLLFPASGSWASSSGETSSLTLMLLV